MEDHVSPRGITVPAAAVSFQFARSSGPGGQHVNTTSSKVHLTIDLALCGMSDTVRARLMAAHGPTVTVVSEQSRSQWRNRHLAMTRALALLDAGTVAPARRIPSKPSRSSQRRRVDSKVKRGQLKAQRRQRDDD